MKFIFISTLFLFASCTNLPKPEMTLLRSWNEDLQNKEPNIPYTKVYSQNKKSLFFIGASHERDLNSSTHKLIKKNIETIRPNLVIIEGVETDYGVNPDFVLKRISNNPPKMNEASYSAKISSENNIPFIGGEISEKKIKKSFESDNAFTPRDLLAFRLIQGMVTFNQSQPNLSLTEAMNEVYSYVDPKNELKGNEVINEVELTNWFKDFSGKDFNYKELTTNDVAPKCQDTATKIQKINCKINRLRNAHLANLISYSLSNYNTVLIIYGAGHQVQLDHVLQSFLPTTRYLDEILH